MQGPQAGVPLVLDLQFDAAGGAQAFDGRGPEDADRGFLEGVELLPQFGGDAAAVQLRVLLALFKRLEDHEHAAHVADVRAQKRGIAGNGDHVAPTPGRCFVGRSC